jgi:hypothetical protein
MSLVKILKKLYRPRLGRIDCDSWLRRQRILAGEVRTYTAADILGTGYRVFEWGNGRHKRATFVKRSPAEGV